jgi:hypothetical protein
MGKEGKAGRGCELGQGREYTYFVFYFLIPINVTIYIPISIIAR